MAKAKQGLNVELMVKLVTHMREQHDNLGALINEFDNLLAGKPSSGELLKQLYAHWDALWLTRWRTKHVWKMDKDAPNMKRLLKMLGFDELAARMHSYIKSDEPYYVDKKHPFALFVTGINGYTGLQRPADQLEAPPVAGCLHSPPCTTDQQHTRRRQADMRVVN